MTLLWGKKDLEDSNDRHIFVANREINLLASPAACVCSCITIGIPRIEAAILMGTPKYPPNVSTMSGFIFLNNNRDCVTPYGNLTSEGSECLVSFLCSLPVLRA